MGHTVDINTACGNVGCDQNADLTILERVQGTFALILAFVAMNRSSTDFAAFKMTRHTIRPALGAGENKGAFEKRVIKQFRQKLTLAIFLDHIDRLLDAFLGRGNRGHRNLDRIGKHITGKLPDLRRHRGREEQVLTITRQHLDNAFDRRQEAKIKHVIGLVEHDDINIVKFQLACINVIKQTARCCDKNVNTRRDRLDLRTMRNPANNNGNRGVHEAAIGTEAVANLGGQFTRRR